MVKIENANGAIEFSAEVLANIVGIAATECYGVYGMSSKNAAEDIVTILKWENYEKGVKVSLEDGKLLIDLHIIVMYGVNIMAITRSIVEKVKYYVEEMSGLPVGKVTVFVDHMKAD